MPEVMHPSRDDIGEVLDFMLVCDKADYGEEDSSLEDLEEQWDGINLEKDAWLLRDEGKLCGYTCLSGEGSRYTLDLYIDSKAASKGWGDGLAQIAVERAKEIKANDDELDYLVLTAYAASVNEELNGIFQRNGFEPHIWQYRMQVDLTEPVDWVVWPPEFEVRPFQPKDEPALYHLIETTFDWLDHVMPSLEEWRNHLFRGGRYEPAHFILVFYEGELAGACLGYKEDTLGWIRQLAVAKPLQGQGLGSKLLKHAIYGFQRLGVERVALGVASVNQNAVDFYERCGMKQTRKYAEYRLMI